MFGADNCRASVAHPGAQLATAGGLAPRSAYQSAHLGPVGVENFHYAPLQNTPPNPRKPLPDFLAEKPSKAFGRFFVWRGHNYFAFHCERGFAPFILAVY